MRTPLASAAGMSNRLRSAVLGAALLALLAGMPRPASGQNSFLTGSAGSVGGLLAGTTVTLGLIVANARLERDFIHGPADIISLQGVPIAVGIIGGGVLGASDPARAERVGLYTGAGMALGAGVGSLIGEAMTRDDPSGKWAGGVIGAAAGVVIGVIAGSL